MPIKDLTWSLSAPLRSIKGAKLESRVLLKYYTCLVSNSSLGKEILVIFPHRVAGLEKPLIRANNFLKRTVYNSIYGKEKRRKYIYVYI